MKWTVFLKAWQDACGLRARKYAVIKTRSSWIFFSVEFYCFRQSGKKKNILWAVKWEYWVYLTHGHHTHYPYIIFRKVHSQDEWLLWHTLTLRNKEQNNCDNWYRHTDLSKIWNVTLINSNLLGLQEKRNSVLLHAVTMKINTSDVWMLQIN